MGVFGNKKSKIDLENIISVVLLEQTQLYGKKNNWGLSFGDTFGSPMVMEQTVPTGSRLKFSVTYRNGKKEIVEVLSGTAEADALLQKAIDPEITDSSGDIQQKGSVPYKPITVQKNQLPTGDYLIGRDIPVGIYDFTWVYGHGVIQKFKNDHDSTLGASTYYENVGAQYDYEYRQCFHVVCAEGELLKITGNLIVEISKSKKIELDL